MERKGPGTVPVVIPRERVEGLCGPVVVSVSHKKNPGGLVVAKRNAMELEAVEQR
jgi:hypothetical protein